MIPNRCKGFFIRYTGEYPPPPHGAVRSTDFEHADGRPVAFASIVECDNCRATSPDGRMVGPFLKANMRVPV